MEIADSIINSQDKDGMLVRAIINTIKLYSEPTHFIYELLQNAEDACASKIHFSLEENQLVVMHDGIPFSKSNLQSLCDIANSDKTHQDNKIGEFGVGFKSVFAICSHVRLYSDPSNYNGQGEYYGFAVDILDFTRPKDIPEYELPDGYTTRFEFPYAIGEKYTRYTEFELLRKDLYEFITSLGYNTLLFLRHLKEISYEISLGLTTKSNKFSIVKKPCTTESMIAYASDSNVRKKRGYLIYSAPVKGVPGHTVDIAYHVDIVDDKIAGFFYERNEKISVYFPTSESSMMPFVVQGPFSTTSNRAEVHSSSENSQLVDQIMDLFFDSLRDMKNNGLFDLDTLDMLLHGAYDSLGPRDLFYRLYTHFLDFLCEEEFIPCINGYSTAPKARLMRGSWLCSVFDDQTLSKLVDFSGATHCKRMSPEITSSSSKYSYLHGFLNRSREKGGLGIKEIDPGSIPGMLLRNPDFYPSMDKSWQLQLLKEMQVTAHLFAKKKSDRTMVDVPFILTNSGKYVKPFTFKGDQKLPNVFIPDASEELNTDVEYIDLEFYRSLPDLYRHILKLTVPDDYSVFIDYLKNTYSGDSDVDSDQYDKDLNTVSRYLKDSTHASDLVAVIQRLKFIYVKKIGSSNSFLASCADLNPYYYCTDEGIIVEAYFKDIETKHYVIDITRYGKYPFVDLLFKNLPLRRSLVYGLDRNTSHVELIAGHSSVLFDQGDLCNGIKIAHLDLILKYISNNQMTQDAKVKSQYIMQLCQKYCDCLSGASLVSDTGERIQWDSPTLQLLKRSPWLYTKKHIARAPENISYVDIDMSMYKGIDKLSPVVSMLGIQLSESDRFMQQIDDIPKEEKRAILNDLLKEFIGLSLNAIEKDERFIRLEFPESPVRNAEKLKNYVRNSYRNAPPVIFQSVQRSVRVSAIDSINKSFVDSVYFDKSTSRGVCQICGESTRYLEVSQLEKDPRKEIQEMHLGLCPECHKKFKELRDTSSYMDKLKAAVSGWNLGDEPVLYLGTMRIRFTESHLYQVKLFMESLYGLEHPVVHEPKVKAVEKLDDISPHENVVPKKKTVKVVIAKTSGTISSIYKVIGRLPFAIKDFVSLDDVVYRVDEIARVGAVLMANGHKLTSNGKWLPWSHNAERDNFVWKRAWDNEYCIKNK